jgi:glycosyltransferase involved in cell wall biosynthesis
MSDQTAAKMEMPCSNVAVVILTLNEAANLPHAIRSVLGWAREIVVVDSNSSDGTAEIARDMGARFFINKFESYSHQRNFALEGTGIASEWILFLDADEWVTDDLKREITLLINSNPKENGFFVKWRMIWMGKWIRRGYYPTWILRLLRRGKGRCEQRSVNEHLIVEGGTGYLSCDFIHEDRKGLDHWLHKHVGYATKEADELLRRDQQALQTEIDAKFWGSQAQRKRWVRYRIWNRLPPLIRPFIYFFYRLILRGGILDGREAVIYHFLHALWLPFLIDAKYLEMKARASVQAGHVPINR